MDTENMPVIRKTVKISRQAAENLKDQDEDISIDALVRETAGSGMQYPIGNSGYAVHLMTYDAVLIAYAAQEPVQDIVDRYTDEALTYEDPEKHLTDFLMSIEEAQQEVHDRSSLKDFSSRAHDFADKHLSYITPRKSRMEVKILWEQPDGSYSEKRPEI